MQNLIKDRLNKNKKGLSEVIANVLIITIGIVAVSLIAFYINGFINRPLLSPTISCIEMQTDSILKIGSACYNVKTNELEVTIKRSSLSEDGINSVKFMIETGTDSNLFECFSNSCSNCIVLDKGEIKTYYFSSEEGKETDEASVYVDNCLLDKKSIGNCD